MLLSVTGSSLRARPMLARASSIPTSPLVMLGDSIGVDAAALEASTTFAGDFAHVDAAALAASTTLAAANEKAQAIGYSPWKSSR
jgi:hypothetical protein